jgi:gamma-glutamylputrescine oxidase
VKARIARHAIACDLKQGVLTAAIAAGHARQLARDAGGLRRDYGHDQLDLLSAEEARRLVRSDRYQGGVLDRSAAHLHPLSYLRGLARAARQAGVRIFEKSPARTIAPDRVTCDRGSIAARHVVLAANVGIGDLSKRLRRTILPLHTFMIATEPLAPERAARVIPGSVAVYDTQVALNYFRLSADHRLLFGGGVTAGPRSRAWIERHLQKAMTEVFPQLSDLRIDYAWSGALDMTANRIVQAGKDADGFWHAQGFSGHGVALTLRTGEAIADAILGKDADLALLNATRHKPIPGGRALAPLTMPLGIAWEKLRRLAISDGFYSL